MKIRRKYNNWIPRILNVGAITLYPFILFKRTVPNLKTRLRHPEYLFKHEYVHIDQVRKLGWFKFYFLYLVESAKHGYKENKYEIDANAREEDPFTEEEQKAFNEDFGL